MPTLTEIRQMDENKVTLSELEYLVQEEYLDLDAIFITAKWATIENVLQFKAFHFDDGSHVISVVLQKAIKYGIVGYRFIATDTRYPDQIYDCSYVVLKANEARDIAKEFALKYGEDDET